jgi:CDP-diglyceride synthetase
VSDGALALIWAAVFAGGIGVCVVLAIRGVPRTLVRDVLHVGAGAWPLGWPQWHGAAVPITVAALGCAGLLAVPALAMRFGWARKLAASVSGDDERWSGLALYGVSSLGMTVLGFERAAFPAAAGLLALALGDGVGGLIGRRWGRTRYRLPWAKSKTVEGSLGVAFFSAAGIALAGWWFGVALGSGLLLAGVLAAAVAEAVSPRSADNLTVPLAVWAVCC